MPRTTVPVNTPNEFVILAGVAYITVPHRDREPSIVLMDEADWLKIKGLGRVAISTSNCGKKYAYLQTWKRSTGVRKATYIHHLVMGQPPKGFDVDHEFHDSLDNQRSQLRIVPHRINSLNRGRLHGHNTSGYNGVSFHKRAGRWRAYATVQKKFIHLGFWDSKEEAATVVGAFWSEILMKPTSAGDLASE